MHPARLVWMRMSRTDFLHFNENDRIETPNGLGAAKAALWLKSPDRRSYTGITMAPEGAPPGVLNLWRGWAVQPEEGDWSLMQDLIYDVLADGHRASGDFIVNWMAYMIQKPEILPQVALVFRGAEGTGKGTLGRALMAIAGNHGLTVSSTEQFAGRFDSHLRDCVFLFADEALWGGDKTAEGKLKQLITEPTKVYEAKGVDACMGRNHVHLMMASNEEWVAPTGPEARRFAVFDVSDERRQDQAYFGAMNRQYVQGGRARGDALRPAGPEARRLEAGGQRPENQRPAQPETAQPRSDGALVVQGFGEWKTAMPVRAECQMGGRADRDRREFHQGRFTPVSSRRGPEAKIHQRPAREIPWDRGRRRCGAYDKGRASMGDPGAVRSQRPLRALPR